MLFSFGVVRPWSRAPRRASRSDRKRGDYQLVTAGREQTPVARTAMLLAWRLENSQGDTGASVASLAKQHSLALAGAG